MGSTAGPVTSDGLSEKERAKKKIALTKCGSNSRGTRRPNAVPLAQQLNPAAHSPMTKANLIRRIEQHLQDTRKLSAEEAYNTLC